MTLRADTEQKRNHVCRERSHRKASPREFKATAVVNGEFKEVKLSDYRGKCVVLFFYPVDFTFVCPTEIIHFSERAEEFHKIVAKVIGASVDSSWTNVPCKDGGLGPMKIPLLADLTKSTSQDYRVLKEDDGVAFRGPFIIDNKGILRQITIYLWATLWMRSSSLCRLYSSPISMARCAQQGGSLAAAQSSPV